MKMKYFNTNPDDENAKEVGAYSFWSSIYGDTFNPIHDFNKLIEYRNNLFEIEFAEIVKENQLEGKQLDLKEIYALRYMWLDEELKVIDCWLNGKPSKPKNAIVKMTKGSHVQLAKYHHYIMEEMQEIEDILEGKDKEKVENTKIMTSYVWQNNPEKELPELYNLMTNTYKLIAPDTTLEQFKAIFTGQPIDESFQPIKWHDTNASELLYFIDRLEQLSNIDHNPKRADYKKLKACFIQSDGKPFSVVWKSLKTNIEINLSPDKQKAIDELTNNF